MPEGRLQVSRIHFTEDVFSPWDDPGVCFLHLVLSLPGGGWWGLLVSPKMTQHFFLWCFYQPSAFWLQLDILAVFASLLVRNGRGKKNQKKPQPKPKTKPL